MRNTYKHLLASLGLAVLAIGTAQAQLGVKLSGASPATPQTSLDVNGAITSRPTTVTVTGNTATIPANVGQVVLTPAATGGPTADITLSLAAVPFPGQMLFVVNNTAQRALLNGVAVSPSQSMIFAGDAASSNFIGASDNLGNHTATRMLNLQGNALTGTGSNIGTAVGLGVQADGGLNIGQNTSGNLFMGFQAGQATTPNTATAQGVRNLFAGYQAGFSNTTGTGNQFIGNQSGYFTTTGSHNMFFGYRSGYTNTTSTQNIFTGSYSGYSNTTGNNNLFTGYQSGYLNSTGSDNLFMGTNSGYNNTASANVFLGSTSGQANTTGANNHFIGYQSGKSNTTGASNLFVGTNSGFNNLAGNYNLFMGTNSGLNSTASDNLFFGYNSGRLTTTGGNNLFMGTLSGENNAAGAFNVFLGTQSGTVNTASNNIFIGYRSGYTNTTGNNNTAVGFQAGQFTTTGGNNTALGYNAGPPTGSGALTNTTAIGYNAQVTQSSSLILGGTGADAVKVGVGTTAPQSTLEINGSLGANYVTVSAAAYTLLATDFYVSYTGTTASTFTLPTGVGVKGRLYNIKNTTAAQTLTVNVPAGEGINGSASLNVPAGQSVQLITSGATAANTSTYEIVNFSAATGGGPIVTASNGLTETNGLVKLGGPLTAATDIATAANKLTFSGTGPFAIGTTATAGLLNISGAMGSSFTGGVNITNTTGAPSGSTLSITPGYAGATGITTGAVAMYDVPNVGNQIFSDNVIPNGTNVNTMGDATNRWSSVFGVNAEFTGSMTGGSSSPTATTITAAATDYFVVPQTAGTTTYTLPVPSASKGRTLIFYAFGGPLLIKTASGGVGIYDPTVFTNSPSASYTLAQYHRITYISDGTNWISIAYL